MGLKELFFPRMKCTTCKKEWGVFSIFLGQGLIIREGKQFCDMFCYLAWYNKKNNTNLEVI